MSSESGQIFVFDVASNSIQVAYSSHAMAVRNFAWSADSTVRFHPLPVTPTPPDPPILAISCSCPRQKTNA